MTTGRHNPPRERMLPAPPLPPLFPARRRPAPVLPLTAAVPQTDGAFLARASAALAAFADAHMHHMQATAGLHAKFLAAQNHAAEQILAAFALPATPSAPLRATLPGPKLDRSGLIGIATMQRSIASVFGPLFASQEGHRFQIRIPGPPMTIIDRLLGIEGEPGSLGGGRLWSESDVTTKSWGLDPAGHASNFMMCESAQGNMLLASWLGADLTHDGSLRYRPLDFDTELVGALPKIGDTICPEIVLERQSAEAGLRLFFFRADVRVRGELRSRGRFIAGLFSEEQLSRPEQVRWTAELDQRDLIEHFPPPAGFDRTRSFSEEALGALAAGDVASCFGPGFERARTHVRTPRIATREMSLLSAVPEFDPHGGPWQRGYMRAEQKIEPDAWYFSAHLPGDPCLPGFLLVEAAVHSLAFYLTATGMTLMHDGWRFEPARGQETSCRFRGQITPRTATLVHEVFVESLVEGPMPRIIADVITRIDGRTIFHGRRLSLVLRPDWPLENFRLNPWKPDVQGDAGPPDVLAGLDGYRRPGAAAALVNDEVENDYPAMLAFALGRATDVFGREFAHYDETTRWSRLPAPPFLFMSRVTRFDPEGNRRMVGSWVETEYDIPADAWYFRENGCATMPLVVAIEVLLQPCGWIMLFGKPGGVLGGHARNLDGSLTLYEEIPRGARKVELRTEILSASDLGSIWLCTLGVKAYVESRLIGEVRTSFGFFPGEALRQQQGVPVTAAETERISTVSDFRVDLTTAPARHLTGSPRLAGPMLLMLDRVTAFDRAGGKAGRGWLRAEKDVDPGEWFFKAHFFQDPVQPGSLGIEALLQLLQFYMIETGMGADIPDARFEPIAIGRQLTWKYRGQVIPENKLIVTEIEIVETGVDEKGVFAVAEGWLWVDGIRVYHATNMGMRIVSGAPGR